MLYLGGKTKIATKIVPAIRAEQGDRPCWEPFCGGLGVTRQLAKMSYGVATDAHPALMSTYAAARSGWVPPTTVSDDDYRRARELPDTDPLKGFVGFFCSFGGKYFGGRARDPQSDRNFADEAARSLLRTVEETKHWTFDRLSFLDEQPEALDAFIYADPPYANTTQYSLPFDSAVFWNHCRRWAAFVPVYVSEFACPVPHREVLRITRGKGVGGVRKPCIDLLVEVLP